MATIAEPVPITDLSQLDLTNGVYSYADYLTWTFEQRCVVCDETKLDDVGCLGAPDLMVEILSPGNSKKEMQLKKLLYEENGVREYWIIDPDHETAFQFVLTEAEVYGPITIYTSDETLLSAIFPTLTIPLNEVFAGR